MSCGYDALLVHCFALAEPRLSVMHPTGFGCIGQPQVLKGQLAEQRFKPMADQSFP